MSMDINKRIFPHIFEFNRLGGTNTPEGREYLDRVKNEINEEYGRYVEVKRERLKIGGNEEIHRL